MRTAFIRVPYYEEIVMTFYDIQSIDPKSPAEGVEMRIIPGKNMTVVFFNLAPGALVPEHSHPHEQIGTVRKGSVELNIAGEKKIVSAGGAYHIPSDMVHSGKNMDSASEVIEIFSPAREDLLQD
jgi:quercetin dioxygenase-like cupin family protein